MTGIVVPNGLLHLLVGTSQARHMYTPLRYLVLEVVDVSGGQLVVKRNLLARTVRYVGKDPKLETALSDAV
jgi:hypothetical protein